MRTSENDEQMDAEETAASSKNRKTKQRVYIPGLSRQLKEGEEMEYDPTAYTMFHTFETPLPCLSFDVVRDSLGDNRKTYPMSCFLVGGTQAERPKDNQLMLMRLSNMDRNKVKEKENSDSDDDESSSSDEDDEETAKAKLPVLHAASIPHHGTINRIKAKDLGDSRVCAVWNDQRGVQIWNLSNALKTVQNMEGPTNTKILSAEKPLHTFAGHSAEGFALAWSPLSQGTLASGDIHNKIFLWKMAEDGRWVVDQRALSDHIGSVEDLQWSPAEEPLLLSCSADRSLRLWDVRSKAKDACICHVPDAHSSDVNVISWNTFDPLIVSGGDDSVLNVWSLKTIQYKQPIASFKHHKGPITSVEWNPNESTTFMASGEDDQTTFWDLALEADTENLEEFDKGEEALISGLPPQLLFVHMGQKEIKEVHWHSQVPGLALTTALDGFHVFKTINIG